MADFTKGKWEITTHPPYSNKLVVIKQTQKVRGLAIQDDILIADCWENEANAHLITAAVNAFQKINPDNPLAVAEALPDMYKALRAFRPVFLTRNDFHQVCFLKEDELWEAVEQALAKAEGKGEK